MLFIERYGYIFLANLMKRSGVERVKGKIKEEP